MINRISKLAVISLFIFFTTGAHAIPSSSLTISKECVGDLCDAWANENVLFYFNLLSDYSANSGQTDSNQQFSLGFGESWSIFGQRQDTIFTITEFDAFNGGVFEWDSIDVQKPDGSPSSVEIVGNDFKVTVGPTVIGTPAQLAVTFFNEPLVAPSVPSPATLALFGIGLAGLGWSRRKKA